MPLANQGYNPPFQPGWDFSPMLPHGPLGAMGNMMAQPLANHAFPGFVPGPMNQQMGLYDRIQAQGMQAIQQQAMREAASRDRAFLAQGLGGMGHLAGLPENHQNRQAYNKLSEMLAGLSTNMANVNPGMVDQAFGSRGSAAVMAMGVTSGLSVLQGTTHPQNAGRITNQLFDQLYNRRGSDMHGIGAGQAGQMFDEMARRGLMGGASNTNMAAGRLKEMSGAVAAMKDLFGANGQPNAPIRQIFEGLEQLTQGSAHWMNGGNMEMMVRRIHSMSHTMSGGLQKFSQLSQSGGALAQMVGLDRSFGMQTAMSSMSFGESFGKLAGKQGFGGLSKDEATMLDQQLRTAAAASPMAKMLGGLMSMHEQGLLQGPAAQLAEAVKKGDPQAMAQMANMTPGQLQQMVQGSGVSGSTAAQFLNGSNQEAISKYGLADKVRGMQAHGEVANFMRSHLQGGLMGGLAEGGINADEMRTLLPKAAEAARQALMGMRPEDLNDPNKRNQIVMQAIRGALGPAGMRMSDAKLKEIAAGAVAGLQGAIERDPNMKRFKNLQGLAAMNRGDIQSDAHKSMARADKEAEVASLTSGLGQGSVLSKVMDAVAGAGKDTNLTDVIAKALGGTDKREVAAALSGPLGNIQRSQAQFRKLQQQLEHVGGDTEKAARIQNQMSAIQRHTRDQVKAVQDLAKQAGIPEAAKKEERPAGEKAGKEGKSGAGEMVIRGTLTIKPDGSANFEGHGQNGGGVPNH